MIDYCYINIELCNRLHLGTNTHLSVSPTFSLKRFAIVLHNICKENSQKFCNHLQTATLSSDEQKHLQCHSSVSTPFDVYFVFQERKMKVLVGGGNCFFRALTFVVCGDQNGRRHIWERILSFVEANRRVFKAYVMTATFEQHITTMR